MQPTIHYRAPMFKARSVSQMLRLMAGESYSSLPRTLSHEWNGRDFVVVGSDALKAVQGVVDAYGGVFKTVIS